MSETPRRNWKKKRRTPATLQLGAAGPHPGAVDVGEGLEIEVHEVAILVLEMGGPELEVGAVERMVEADLASHRPLRPQLGVAAEGPRAGQGEEARELGGAAGRGPQPSPSPGRTPQQAKARVDLERVGGGRVRPEGGLQEKRAPLLAQLQVAAARGPSLPVIPR